MIKTVNTANMEILHYVYLKLKNDSEKEKEEYG